MSLIIATRFNSGILIACDSFVFDNDGEVPLKKASFDKVHISTDFNCAMTAVGSSWVFQTFCEWFEAGDIANEQMLGMASSKWAELNTNWKANRRFESQQEGHRTLRPLSDSRLILIQGDNLETICTIDAEGNVTQTEYFVCAGSGTRLVESYFLKSGRIFSQKDTLSTCFDLLKACYLTATIDLYVLGVPSLVLITSGGIFSLASQCAETWERCNQEFFEHIKTELLRNNLR